MAEQQGRVKHFSYPYPEDVFGELESSLSGERMNTYLEAVDGDRERAARLYAWNTAVSAAFYASLQALEVALRSAMHSQLASRYGTAWYDNRNAGLDKGAAARIVRAKTELVRNRYAPTPPRMVAALSLGFWVSLLGPGGHLDEPGRKANYEMTLWRPALRGAFPHRATLTRKQIHGPLDHLRAFRNRIAHHEPIFARHLAKDHDQIMEIMGWISPGTRAWLEHHSYTPDLLESPKDAERIRF